MRPETGRARLSYRRAEEIFEENTQLLANPLASPKDIEDLDGWTLHRLRHSALTHDAEDGTSTPMLLARSRHASVRSLERYARPGPAMRAARSSSPCPDTADASARNQWPAAGRPRLRWPSPARPGPDRTLALDHGCTDPNCHSPH
ncbi:site-specific integrase [Streptomyces decoyicus]|uniref:site-specific integrase n=1 Tax=Streptomyces decoyicus TaxID=249567 RepID=UPI0033D190E6